MRYTIESESELSPVQLADMGKKFSRLHRNVGKFVDFTRAAQFKWTNGQIRPIGDARNPKPSGAIIETYRDTASDLGGDTVNVPVIGHLSKPPYGATEIEGLGENVPVYNRKVGLTILRKPITLMTKMDRQKTPLSIVNAVNDKDSWLYDWWAYHWDGNIQHSLTTGYDVMLSPYRELSLIHI